MSTESLFERVIRSTGLPAYIGPSAVRRALSLSGCLSPEAAGPEDYRRALPQLQARMRIYLSQAEVDRRVGDIEASLALPVEGR
jgi:hypothetical protein